MTEVSLMGTDFTAAERLSGVAENVVALGVEGNKRNDVEIKAPIQILRNAERLNKMFNFIMVGIASFSLVVGGIGIMNIMLATVTERTREIGIRRALGAKQKDIVMQFLVEAVVQTTVGGLCGVIIGIMCVYTIPPVWNLIRDSFGLFDSPALPAKLHILITFISPAFSTAVGIIFGLYPAWRASRLDPIEALRHD